MSLEADTVHGILFVEPGSVQGDALQLWDIVFPNERPTAFQSNQSTPVLQSSASGEKDDWLVNIVTQVGRIEIVLSALATVESAAQGILPRIPDYPTAAYYTAEVLMKLARGLKITRIALILDLAKTIPPGEEVSQLRSETGLDVFPEGATDLNHQYNAQRLFTTVEQLGMNRLCMFSSGMAGVLNGQFGMIPSGSVTMLPFVGMKVDVNSSPLQRIPEGNTDAVISEITDEAVRIARDGVEALQ